MIIDQPPSVEFFDMNTHRWINLPGLSRSDSDDSDDDDGGGDDNDNDKNDGDDYDNNELRHSRGRRGHTMTTVEGKLAVMGGAAKINGGINI